MGERRGTDPLRKNDKSRLLDLVKEGGEDLAVSFLTAFLFYRSPFALILILPFSILNHKRIQKDRELLRQERFHRQFRELLNILATSLSGGYSIERAFAQAEGELMELYPEGTVFQEDLKQLNRRVRLNQPVEKAFMEFAASWPYEEVSGFAEIFAFAKRLGGDYGKNIRKTAVAIGENLELEQEIEALTADKKLELRIMCLMPLGILLYISLASPEFLQASYHNPAGVLVMTVCLAVYMTAIFLGRRIIQSAKM
ncbi:MAG: type II secretion system F family protein [Lachnospiraceae bacterium]|nr:type II secretion system F family protein [Lachnospiraceae bacterium]